MAKAHGPIFAHCVHSLHHPILRSSLAVFGYSFVDFGHEWQRTVYLFLWISWVVIASSLISLIPFLRVTWLCLKSAVSYHKLCCIPCFSLKTTLYSPIGLQPVDGTGLYLKTFFKHYFCKSSFYVFPCF